MIRIPFVGWEEQDEIALCVKGKRFTGYAVLGLDYDVRVCARPSAKRSGADRRGGRGCSQRWSGRCVQL